MGKFYEDLTSKSNDAFTKGFFGGKPVNIKLKTKPAEKMLLKHKFRIYRTSSLKKDVEVFSHQVRNVVALKTCCVDNQVSNKFKFSNSETICLVSYKPKDINKDGKSLTLKHNSAFNTTTNEIKSIESLKFATDLFGKSKLGVTVDYAW